MTEVNKHYVITRELNLGKNIALSLSLGAPGGRPATFLFTIESNINDPTLDNYAVNLQATINAQVGEFIVPVYRNLNVPVVGLRFACKATAADLKITQPIDGDGLRVRASIAILDGTALENTELSLDPILMKVGGVDSAVWRIPAFTRSMRLISQKQTAIVKEHAILGSGAIGTIMSNVADETEHAIEKWRNYHQIQLNAGYIAVHPIAGDIFTAQVQVG